MYSTSADQSDMHNSTRLKHNSNAESSGVWSSGLDRINPLDKVLMCLNCNSGTLVILAMLKPCSLETRPQHSIALHHTETKETVTTLSMDI